MTQAKLEQTKGSFVMRGIVEGVDKQGFYNTGTIQNGKSAGKEYRSVRFQVQTSPTNKLTVELFGMEQDYVYPYKRAAKKGDKGTTMKWDFEKRDKLPDGFTLIGNSVALEQDEKGKNIRKNLVAFDAVDYIYETLQDGDSVYITGELQFSIYEDKLQTKYVIGNIYKEKEPIDFEDEKFEEVASFEQEIVFTGAVINKEEKTVEVTGYTIQYGDKFTACQFVIRPDGDADIQKTANAFAKKLKFGDFVKVNGLCLNRAETTEVKVVEKSANSDLFGNTKAKGTGKSAVTTWTVELQIVGADGSTYVSQRYSEEDFVVEELIEENEENPFGDNDGDNDGDDEGLPF